MLRSWSVRISLAALGAAVLGPLLAFLGLLPPLGGFMVFGLSAVLGLVGVLAGIVAVLRRNPRAGAVAIGLGLLTVLCVLVPAFTQRGGHPPINDVATDLQDVPAFSHAAKLPENAGRDLAFPPHFQDVVEAHYADLKPLRLSESPDAAFQRAVALARTTPRWEVTHVDPGQRTFEGVAKSGIFRFEDDFVVRVQPDGASSGARVDMRSKSRDGRGDLGVNAARIRDFFARLQAGK